ncbi:MAG: hypothetical protein P8L85_03770 [Rubripirellula sp.]|nr:hypothetical protein [Rubripirellula sp.]
MPKPMIETIAWREASLPNITAISTTLCCLLMAGCTLGPRQIPKERLEYNQAVQKSFREEMLLNLVRLRYRETPEFLSVGGIAAQYTFDGRASGSLALPDGGTKVGGLSGGVSRTERPTISYVPARGEAFQKGLLAPIDLESLELLGRTGWSWERILRTTVQYMNQVDNATSAGGPTPELKPDFEEFRYVAQVMRQLQIQRAIELSTADREGTPKPVLLTRDQLDGDFAINAIKEGFAIKETEEGISLVKKESYLAFVIHPKAKLSGELQELAEILDLNVDYDSPKPAVYPVESAKEGWIQSTFADATGFQTALNIPCADEIGIAPIHLDDQVNEMLRDDIVVSTRSLLEVMYYLSHGVNVPAEHQSQGLVTLTTDQNGAAFDWSEMMHDLFTVRACKHYPQHASVAVQHRDYWFYIDERDQDSLSTYTLLVELFGIEVRAGGGGGFLYTLGI